MFVIQEKTFLFWNVAKFGKARDLGSRNFAGSNPVMPACLLFYNKHFLFITVITVWWLDTDSAS